MIAKKDHWQLQEAKARLSQLVRQACAEGPQTITLRGEEAVVVVSAAEYARMAGRQPTLLEALLKSPIRPQDVHLFDRLPEQDREIDLSDLVVPS